MQTAADQFILSEITTFLYFPKQFGPFKTLQEAGHQICRYCFFVKYIYWSPNIILQITFTYGYKITNFTQMQVLKIHMKLHVLSLSWRPFWYLVLFALSVLTGFWGRLICPTITVWIHCSCVFTLNLFMSVISMVLDSSGSNSY